jgi:hypothetical protein
VTAISVLWHELPARVRAAIEEHAGPVTGCEPAGEGLSSSLRLILRTARGSVFAKGCGPGDGESQAWRLDLSARLSPHVGKISAPLLWRVTRDGWDVLGFEYLPGRPWADQKPGSPDIPKMLRILRELEGIPAPPALGVTAADCWGQYADDPAALDGDALVHRDPNPTNFVVGADRAWLVDWGWAVRGPAWLTAAQLVLSMVESGWEPGAAEHALSALRAWCAVPARTVAAFAAANARMWEAAVTASPGWPHDFRAGVARTWAAHRAHLAGTRM